MATPRSRQQQWLHKGYPHCLHCSSVITTSCLICTLSICLSKPYMGCNIQHPNDHAFLFIFRKKVSLKTGNRNTVLTAFYNPPQHIFLTLSWYHLQKGFNSCSLLPSCHLQATETLWGPVLSLTVLSTSTFVISFHCHFLLHYFSHSWSLLYLSFSLSLLQSSSVCLCQCLFKGFCKSKSHTIWTLISCSVSTAMKICDTWLSTF